MALQSIALYCSNSCYSLKIRTMLLKSMPLFPFQLETFYWPKRTELWGGEDNSCLHSYQQTAALCVAQREPTLPNLLGVACNLHWGQKNCSSGARNGTQRPFTWATTVQVAVLPRQPQPGRGKQSLTFSNNKRQMRGWHGSRSSLKCWGGSCWK